MGAVASASSAGSSSESKWIVQGVARGRVTGWADSTGIYFPFYVSLFASFLMEITDNSTTFTYLSKEHRSLFRETAW